MKNCSYIRLLTALVATLLIAGCSSTPDETYMSSQGTHALEVPPNLSQPVSNPDFLVPGISSQQTTYSGYTSAESQAKDVLPKIGKDVVFVRDGGAFWLEIDKTPNEIWPMLKGFVGKTGFEIKYANQAVGIIDTSWRENEDGASWMTTMTSGDQGVYMDKYRLRLERGKNAKTTRVFITHKGARIAKDVVNAKVWDDDEDTVDIADNANGKTLWVARPSDPELEIEMLRSFMLYIGLDKDAVSDELSVYSNKKIAKLVEEDKGLALEVKENFPRTWRRVGLALDRIGFVVDDLNRSAGVYYISLPEKFSTKEEKTWFDRMLNTDKGELPKNFLLTVSEHGQETRVTIRNRNSATMDNKVAEKILRQIQAHIS